MEVVEDRRVLSAFTVLNLNDSGQGSLRDAVTAANENPGADLIHFQRRLGGTITLTSGQMEITDDLTIRGNGVRRLTISGNETSRIFQMGGAETDVEIKDLTIANGRNTMKDDIGIILTRGGGILNDGGVLTLSRVTMRNNQAIDISDAVASSDVVGGGAVANTGNGKLTATHCRFIGNVVSGGLRYAFGGAIANVSDSIAVITNSVFVRNEAMGGSTSYGGAIGNFGSSQLTVSGSTFRFNTARGLNSLTASAQEAFGGAIATRPGTVVSSGSTTTIDRSLFIGNRALGARQVMARRAEMLAVEPFTASHRLSPSAGASFSAITWSVAKATSLEEMPGVVRSRPRPLVPRICHSPTSTPACFQEIASWVGLQAVRMERPRGVHCSTPSAR